jgi:ParB family chromosome partitioning protein
MARKRKLGRGLDALLGGNASADKAPASEPVKPGADSVAGEPVRENETSSRPSINDGQLADLPVDLVQRGKYQPRRDIQPEALEELAGSIRAQGVMQPIVVRKIGEQDGEPRYEIIAGERRWRASQQAGLQTIPALIRDVTDEAAIAMSLIENIQREDLNPMEEAVALQRLKDEFGLTHQEVAEAVGKNRSTVTNLMRLTGLNREVQAMLEQGQLEMGHGRAILSLPDEEQRAAAHEVVNKGLSVRQTEALVRKQLKQQPGKPSGKKLDPDIRVLQDDLAGKLGASVSIQHSGSGKGKLVIKYNSLDELDGILGHIK